MRRIRLCAGASGETTDVTTTNGASYTLRQVLATLLGGRVDVQAASADKATGVVDVSVRLPELPPDQREQLRSWVKERLALAEATLAEDGFIFWPSFS
jgi:hypothetical protein